MFFMWWIMMVAMMLPSAAPMILLFAALNRKQRDSGQPYVATSIFALGYLAAWAGFSLVATMLQRAFELTGVLSPRLVATNVILGGVLLVAAGAYQLTPVKHACLRHCRSPLAFLGTRWQRGARGALRMGVRHGAYCVGCCWFLMGLLFFGGVMNLYWIAGLALFVLFEKTIPAGHWLGYATGIGLSVWGAALLGAVG
jgi:predicted metal-binding membrane protein